MIIARPSIGRIVHYVSYGTPGGEHASECWAAIVTQVFEKDDNGKPLDWMAVSLAVFSPKGLFFDELVFAHENKPGTWHWPEQVEAL